jgi:hypothetical protein
MLHRFPLAAPRLGCDTWRLLHLPFGSPPHHKPDYLISSIPKAFISSAKTQVVKWSSGQVVTSFPRCKHAHQPLATDH